jgi:hypothetical protein
MSISIGPILVVLLAVLAEPVESARNPLQRRVPTKPDYSQLSEELYTDHVVLKLAEGVGPLQLGNQGFNRVGVDWDRLNGILRDGQKTTAVKAHFSLPPDRLEYLRQLGQDRIAAPLPDLNLYYRVDINPAASANERLDLVRQLNSLDIVEIAFFSPKPRPASVTDVKVTPMWEPEQYYLQPAPTGLDAYYAWAFGNKGAGVKVVDIEGNWIQTHEDLHGGTDNFHIAGAKINDAGWWNHGTAVLGEIAADSNGFGMTGISFNVDLGTVSIGSLSTSDALTIATNNSDTGDIILIELHAPGPHYDFETVNGQDGYVAMEYWQDVFDAIVVASAAGRIVVEAAGNGSENYDDTSIYEHLMDPNYRWSGAVMVGASDANHWPASFTNYGQRVDVHGFGTWDVYTLGYGDLFGTGPDDYYTGTFAGTSSASPIIVGACALLQELHKTAHGRILYEDEMHDLLTTFSTPQQPHPKHIGPLPNLHGSTDQVLGVSFTADTTVGWLPLDVAFQASSALSVDSWLWNFGDGETSTLQNPSHQYNLRGVHDVSVQITAGSDVRTATRQQFVTVLADSMWADSQVVTAPGLVEVVVYGSNTVPIEEIRVPIEYTGTLDLEYADSFSTAGCRTDYFQYAALAGQAPEKVTFRLISSTDLSAPDLPPGSGPILKVYFNTAGAPSIGQATPIVLDGYSTSYMPRFRSDLLDYNPWTFAGSVAYPNCCIGIRGNINGDALQTIDISDLVYMVDYMFQGGPVPPCLKEVNVNGDIFEQIGIDDLVYLVDYMFSGGPAPAVCF